MCDDHAISFERELHERFRDLGNYRLFRYEDLLTNPERVLRELCEFIETEFRRKCSSPRKAGMSTSRQA